MHWNFFAPLPSLPGFLMVRPVKPKAMYANVESWTRTTNLVKALWQRRLPLVIEYEELNPSPNQKKIEK